jgi:hypothetical protein
LRLCSDCVTESPDNTLPPARDGMLRLCGDCGLHNREPEVRRHSRWLSEMEDGSQPWGHGPITRVFVTKAMMTRRSNAPYLLSLAERGPIPCSLCGSFGPPPVVGGPIGVVGMTPSGLVAVEGAQAVPQLVLEDACAPHPGGHRALLQVLHEYAQPCSACHH